MKLCTTQKRKHHKPVLNNDGNEYNENLNGVKTYFFLPEKPHEFQKGRSRLILASRIANELVAKEHKTKI